MQDLSYKCLESIKDSSLWWCPDLDGPCMDAADQSQDKGHDSRASVVYCLDDSYCNQTHINSTPQDFICTKDTKKPDPLKNPDSNCSNIYYKCEVGEIGERMGWRKHFCPEDEEGQVQVFSPDVNKCTVGCNPDPNENPCPEDGCDEGKCTGYDDTSTLWEANEGETREKDCNLWKENLKGSQTWQCKKGPDFEGNRPDRSDCEEDWIDDIEDQVIIDIGLLWQIR